MTVTVISRLKNWIAETLTATDLNAEFNNIVTYLNTNLSLDTDVFTPTDASGASLTLTTPVGYYRKFPGFVLAWGSFTYPATADTSPAKIGGLPYTSANLSTQISGFLGNVTFGGGGGTPGGAAPNWLVVIKNSKSFEFRYAGSVVITNANASTYNVNFTVMYPI